MVARNIPQRKENGWQFPVMIQYNTTALNLRVRGVTFGRIFPSRSHLGSCYSKYGPWTSGIDIHLRACKNFQLSPRAAGSESAS